jgi:hypothetical protein
VEIDDNVSLSFSTLYPFRFRPKNHVKKTRIRVGTYSPKGDKPNNNDYQEFGIVDLMVHPGFVYVGDDEFILDFMLLKLDGFSTKAFVTINVKDSVPASHQEVFALGVGSTNPEPDGNVIRPKNLQEVNLNYISNHECSDSVDPVRNITYQGRIDPSTFCTTGGPNNTRDAWYVQYVCILSLQCNTIFQHTNTWGICALNNPCSFSKTRLSYYDSGSPVIIKGNKPEQDVLVGLVSWGELCGDPNFPGTVYSGVVVSLSCRTSSQHLLTLSSCNILLL